MTPLETDISGTTLEIRIVEVGTGEWRWLLCAVATPWPDGRERHLAAWSRTAVSADKAFAAAMEARKAVIADTSRVNIPNGGTNARMSLLPQICKGLRGGEI